MSQELFRQMRNTISQLAVEKAALTDRLAKAEAELSRMRDDLISHETCVCGWTMFHASSDDRRWSATVKVDAKYPIAAALKGGAK